LVLLALNPIFLFRSGSAVVEPLLTTLLIGAALAAMRGRLRLAALLAALAAITATKAWIWIGAAVAFVVIEQVYARVTRRTARPIPAAAWAVPAVALLVVMQLGYAPAGHSIARGSAEVLSATSRGSHRYLYPALPSLALLAAAALDRQPAIARVGSAATGALLAVAFLPVFAGFAAGNAGLIAAGKVASNSSGLLVTDSPAVAFYSRKAPIEITGSQALPAGREAAIAWMRGHGVAAVVLEGISYYRATSTFPDL